MQRIIEQFASQPTGDVVSPNEAHLYESRKQHTHNLAIPIMLVSSSS